MVWCETVAQLHLGPSSACRGWLVGQLGTETQTHTWGSHVTCEGLQLEKEGRNEGGACSEYQKDKVCRERNCLLFDWLIVLEKRDKPIAYSSSFRLVLHRGFLWKNSQSNVMQTRLKTTVLQLPRTLWSQASTVHQSPNGYFFLFSHVNWGEYPLGSLAYN